MSTTNQTTKIVASTMSQDITIVFNCIQIPVLTFLCLILHPLYKVAFQRKALYILMSKTCATAILQLSLSIYRTIKFTLNISIKFYDDYYPYFSQILYMTIYMHILGLAINRLFAIFSAFQYPRIWTTKNTALFILCLWLIGIPLGIMHIQLLVINNYAANSVNLSSIVQWSITASCGTLYGIMVAKFANERMLCCSSHSSSISPDQQNLEKDRMRIFVICLISVISVPFNQIFVSIQSFFPIGTTLWTVASALIIANLAMVNCIEQCTLIVFCEDFRKLIGQRFKKYTNKWNSSANQATVIGPSMVTSSSTMAKIRNVQV